MVGCALFLLRDTTGAAALGLELERAHGWRLLAVGEAAETLEAAGCVVERVELGAVAGLLADKGAGVRALVTNFASVESTGRGFLSWKAALAAFDRGHVAAMREAVWQADRVAVVGGEADYKRLLEELERGGGRTSQAFRTGQATAALQAASAFDYAVAQYLEIHGAEAPDLGALSGYPKATRLAWPRALVLANGENRQQQAALYGSFFEHFEQVSGPALDYEGVLSVSRATYCIGEYEKPTAALWRMGRLTAAASGRDVGAALRLGRFGDFGGSGGWLAVNATLEQADEAAVAGLGLAGLVLPDADEAARERWAAVAGLRVLVAKSGLGYDALQEVRSVVGGALLQDKDRTGLNPMTWTVAGTAQPTVEDWEALYFAARLARHLDSCGCVCARGESVVAIEQGRATPSLAWQGIVRGWADLAGTALVFDDALDGPEVLTAIKAAGVRVVLHAGTGSEAENGALRAAANDLGLTLMGMGRTLRRF